MSATTNDIVYFVVVVTGRTDIGLESITGRRRRDVVLGFVFVKIVVVENRRSFLLVGSWCGSESVVIRRMNLQIVKVVFHVVDHKLFTNTAVKGRRDRRESLHRNVAGRRRNNMFIKIQTETEGSTSVAS